MKTKRLSNHMSQYFLWGYFKKYPQCQIAKALQISSSTVHYIFKRFRETGEISLCKGQGRKTFFGCPWSSGPHHSSSWFCHYKYNIKLRWALFVTYTIIQSITSNDMCSLHLTHPSAHTPGAAREQLGVRSWTIPAGAEIQTHHNLGLLQVSSPTLYPLGHDCPSKHWH